VFLLYAFLRFCFALLIFLDGIDHPTFDRAIIRSFPFRAGCIFFPFLQSIIASFKQFFAYFVHKLVMFFVCCFDIFPSLFESASGGFGGFPHFWFFFGTFFLLIWVLLNGFFFCRQILTQGGANFGGGWVKF